MSEYWKSQSRQRILDALEGSFKDQNEACAILAEVLGYSMTEDYGYAIGDHTVVTLAMQAAESIKILRGQ